MLHSPQQNLLNLRSFTKGETMADWLKNALSTKQEEENKILANERDRYEKITALKATAVEYIKNSGVYNILIKYFTDLNDSEAITKVKEAQATKYIPCNIYRGYSYQRNLEYIDIKEDGYHDPESGWISQNEGSGDIFHSQVKLSNGTKICEVSVLVKLCRDEKFVFTPVLVIVFDSGNEEGKDIFAVINPPKTTLYNWLKKQTAFYISEKDKQNKK